MEAVAAGDQIALELARPALVLERDPGPVGVDVVHRDAAHLEEERLAGVQADPDQVLHDLGLAVDHDRRPAGQLAQRDAVPLAVELEADPMVDDSLAGQPLACAGTYQRVHRALFENAGADTLLDVVAAPRLEHDRLDPLGAQELGEGQPGRPGADDPHLCAHRPPASASITRCAIANAAFAAGTPQ